MQVPPRLVANGDGDSALHLTGGAVLKAAGVAFEDGLGVIHCRDRTRNGAILFTKPHHFGSTGVTMHASALPSLSPRQRDCLRLVHDRRATSKEIAAELGISKSTVDGYIAEAVELLGARDRREAGRMAFGEGPRAESGGDATRVPEPPALVPPELQSTRPWRTRQQPRNALTPLQTFGWIAVIAIGSLLALALATIIGNGIVPVAREVKGSIGRPTH